MLASLGNVISMTDVPAAVTLGLDFGGSSIKVALLRAGRVIAADRRPNRSRPSDLDEVAAAARALVDRTGPADRVAVAMPGIVDPSSGRLVSAHGKYGYAHDLDLVGWAERELGHRAVVENDARVALLGEVTTGSARGARDAALVVVGTGIGTAAMIDGVLVRGHRGHAGVLGGHFTITMADQACNCGNLGCAEVFGGSWNLPDGLDMPAVFAGLGRGEAGVTEVANRVLQAWAVTAVNLCHAYDPEVLVMSGGAVAAAGGALRWVVDYVRAHHWSSLPPPEIVVADEPELSVVRGLDALAESGAR